jgi:hypothetical protein
MPPLATHPPPLSPVFLRTTAVLKMTEQIKAISEKWKALGDAERQPYLERAALDKQRYLAEKEALAAVS